jgi:hypothetical protein
MSREYSIWRAMKGRCLNPTATGFENYGGRGITVCDRWRESFKNFLADMGRCQEGMTLDRIDNDGHYRPGNCRWATRSEQGLNTRQSRRLDGPRRRWTLDGERISMAQIADYLAIGRRTLYRLREGLPKHMRRR